MKLASRYDFKVSNESAARAEVESFFIKTLDWLMTGDNSASPQVLGLATGDWSSILGDCDTLLVNVSRVWVTRYTQYPVPNSKFPIPQCLHFYAPVTPTIALIASRMFFREIVYNLGTK